LAAVSLAKILKVPNKNIQDVLKKEKGLFGRIEYLKRINKVRFFNDTASTTPESTIFAILKIKEKYPKLRLILIAGGDDKNLNYKNLAKIILDKVDILFLLPGTATEKIKKELKNKEFPFFQVKSLKEAIKKIKKVMKTNDIVLFSPAGTSFGLFKNEFERGKLFLKYLKCLR